MKRKFLILAFLCGINYPIYAALLTFSDGSKLEGKIKEAKSDKIIIETEFGDIERLRSEIFSITDLSAEETGLLESKKNTSEKPTSAPVSQEKNHPSPPVTEPIETESKPSPDFSVSVNIPPVEPVKNIALNSTLDAIEEKDTGEDSNDLSDIEQSAYNSLLLLKNKLSQNFETKKNTLIQGYEKERTLLEKNLRDLTQKYNELKEISQEKDLRLSTLDSQMQQYKEQQLKAEESISAFKKQLQELEEKTVRAEISRTEDIKNALTRNKELLEKEKQAFSESYEGQITELKKQLENASQKTLELAKENTRLSEKLADSEKSHELTKTELTAKEKELETFKADIKKQFGEFSEKTTSDKSAIEKTLVSSAETISHLREYNSKLNDENNALKEQCESLKKDTEALKEDIDNLEKEKEQYKKEILDGMDSHRIFKKKVKKRQEKLLQSLVTNAMAETEKATLPSAEAETVSTEKGDTASEEKISSPSRLEILGLVQEDMKELNSKLDISQKNLLRSEKEKSRLKAELKEAQEQIKYILTEQKSAEDKARQMEKEKIELKKQLENLIHEIREEARQNIEKQKDEFKKQFDDSLKNFEQKKLSTPLAQDAQDITGEEALISTDEALPVPSSEEVEKSLAPSEPQNPAPPPVPAKIEIGNISQIEPDLKRVFIDTKEKIKKGDIVFVQTEDGEAPFKIITVYDDSLMKGAIAEIKNKKLLPFIKLKDVVYIQ